MAGLEGLASIIYHEKQQSGSMLCAQHALNSLLQGPYFTAPDLSEIARRLDTLEEQYNADSRRGGSKNMDDTGFFSVQVMEEALEVWGLNLVRWRSSTMRPYQDHPDTQLAFILNLEQHWFTLRRFGPASADIDDDPGQGHWFNLNSSLLAPEWVGKLYLGMVLQQAESEGYSVFAVTQADPTQPLALPRTEADDIASTLPEPQLANSSSQFRASKRVVDTPGSSTQPSGSGNRVQEGPQVEADDLGELEGVEDEDYDLQAALQASLVSQEGYGSQFYEDGTITPPPLPPSLVPASSSSRTYSAAAGGPVNPNTQPSLNLPGHADLDPVSASMERNRVLLQRMREQQEFAQRELLSSPALTPEEQAIQDIRRQERLRQEEEEAEQLRQAIAESEAMAQEMEGRQQSQPSQDDLITVDRDVDYTRAPNSGFSAPEHRNYDDEDAELQAALRASLENLPPEWQHPELSQPTPPKRQEHPTQPQSAPATNNKTPQDMDVDEDEDEEWHSDSESERSIEEGSKSTKTGSAPEPASSAMSLAEIRQARLARFGG